MTIARPKSRPAIAPASTLALASLVAVSASHDATAWQRPPSAAELTERSVLIVVGEILGVARAGGDPEAPARYLAWVQVARAEKGDIEVHATLQVGWTALDPNRLGAFAPTLYPGERVRLYLANDKKEPGLWRVVDGRGFVALRRAPKDRRKLPEKPGEVLFRSPTDGPDGADPKTTLEGEKPGPPAEDAKKARPAPRDGPAAEGDRPGE